ncbi:MAG: enoyl-CoA hydratase-related protein [bacterium]
MGKISIRYEDEGQVARLILDAPKANILDEEMITALTSAVQALQSQPAVKLMVFEGAGRHFSFGSSVEEHQAEPAKRMIPAFGNMFSTIIDSAIPSAALVRGQCLGGGMELAVFCNWVFAEPGAHFGQPEIQLAVFAPVASLVLPGMIGQQAADEICLTGRSFSAEEALRAGMVRTVAEDAEGALRAFIEGEILPKSAAALRIANRASRSALNAAFRNGWREMERLYLEETMATFDANEGIAAFMEKRPPAWQHR